jgi:hypothetical protein
MHITAPPRNKEKKSEKPTKIKNKEKGGQKKKEAKATGGRGR